MAGYRGKKAILAVRGKMSFQFIRVVTTRSYAI
jgi:hypothetical protein